MTDKAGEYLEARADRRKRCDKGPARGTNGAPPGTSGAALPRHAWLAVVAPAPLILFVNVMTGLDDARRRGVAMPLALPLTLEVTSFIAALIASVVVFAAMRLAPPGRGPWWRTALVQLAGSAIFSGAHVALMTLLRTLAFNFAGHRYPWALADFPYEYRKDLLTYGLMAGILWMLMQRRPARAAGTTAAGTAPAAPDTFDIRDGASILRVPIREILAARAAGNYIEFALEDGRRPLMRATVAQIEARLAPRGFLRTHRSWLVNTDRVRALNAAGSGDFRIDLGGGLTAPLSRRYPHSLARLRGEGERVSIMVK